MKTLLRRKWILLVVVVALTAAAGGAYWWFTGTAAASETDEVAVEPQHLYSVPEFTTNLADDQLGRNFIQLKIELQVTAAKEVRALQVNEAGIMDAVLTLLHSRSPRDLSGEEGLSSLRRDILECVNEIVGPETVTRVYFTKLLVQ